MADINKSRELDGRAEYFTERAENCDYKVEDKTIVTDEGITAESIGFRITNEPTEYKPIKAGDYVAKEPEGKTQGNEVRLRTDGSAGDLTVKIDVDVSEALTGLKAVTREAKAAQKALRELESIQHTLREYDLSDVPVSTVQRLMSHLDANASEYYAGIQQAQQRKDERVEPDYIEFEEAYSKFGHYDLSDVPTKELSEELAEREGGETFTVNPHGAYAKLYVDNGEEGGETSIKGPATILVNKD